MGRAYEVRKASIQKTGAARGKLYSMYAKEIYQAAKTGGCETVSNAALKRLIDRAKKDQVPADIIKRAIDKVNSGVDESYDSVRYEVFGPAGSTIIIDCLTDNVNRSISSVRAALNKTKCKLGGMGSITYNYDNLCIISFKGLTEEQTLDALIENEIDNVDMELEDGEIILYGAPQDNFKIKEAITKVLPDVQFDMDEISMLPKDKVKLEGEDLEMFNRLITLLDDVEDVNHVYHNVELN